MSLYYYYSIIIRNAHISNKTILKKTIEHHHHHHFKPPSDSDRALTSALHFKSRPIKNYHHHHQFRPLSSKPSTTLDSNSNSDSQEPSHKNETGNSDGSPSNQPPPQPPSPSYHHTLSQYLKAIKNLTDSSAYLRPFQERFKSIKHELSKQFDQLPTRLSLITGYGNIDQLKNLVAQKEFELRASREAAIDAKINYNQAAQRRAQSIKEVNDLLARKASWSDEDLARFTTLVRTDHSNEQAEAEAKKALEESEAQVDHRFTGMMQAILTRYHEEQVWSDKIRALSTTFSLSITLINVLVFLAAIILVEPYKRMKVVSEVEQRIIARDSNNADILDQALNAVVDRLSSTEKQLSELVLALKSSPAPSGLASSDPRDDQSDAVLSPIPAALMRPVEGIETSPMEGLGSKSEEAVESFDSEDVKVTQQIPAESEEEHDSSEAPPSSSSEPTGTASTWYDRWNQFKKKVWHWTVDTTDYPIQSDQELMAAIGISTIIGIILISTFRLADR